MCAVRSVQNQHTRELISTQNTYFKLTPLCVDSGPHFVPDFLPGSEAVFFCVYDQANKFSMCFYHSTFQTGLIDFHLGDVAEWQ